MHAYIHVYILYLSILYDSSSHYVESILRLTIAGGAAKPWSKECTTGWLLLLDKVQVASSSRFEKTDETYWDMHCDALNAFILPS